MGSGSRLPEPTINWSVAAGCSPWLSYESELAKRTVACWPECQCARRPADTRKPAAGFTPPCQSHEDSGGRGEPRCHRRRRGSAASVPPSDKRTGAGAGQEASTSVAEKGGRPCLVLMTDCDGRPLPHDRITAQASSQARRPPCLAPLGPPKRHPRHALETVAVAAH